VAAVVCGCLCLQPARAAADWLITPFLGLKLDGQTTLVDLDQAAGAPKMTIGGSVALLGDGIVGLEGDFGFTPGFFDSNSRGALVAHSNVMTLTGNVLLAAPAGLTRESLRPYILGGLGLMRASIDDVTGVFPLRPNFLALAIGGGAIGGLTERTSVRFDLRRFQNLTTDPNRVMGFGRSRLSFWRADVGLTFRY